MRSSRSAHQLSGTDSYACLMDVLIIDGANVIGSRPDGWWRDRPGAARGLHQKLSTADLPQNEVMIVLEGEAKRGVQAGQDGRIRTVHAAGSGDDAIFDEVVGSRRSVTGVRSSWLPPTGSCATASRLSAPAPKVRCGSSTSCDRAPDRLSGFATVLVSVTSATGACLLSSLSFSWSHQPRRATV